MVTFSVGHCWFCPIHKPSTQPTLQLRQNEIHREQMSSTTWQTSTQLPLLDWRISDVRQPPFPQLFMETSHCELLWGRARMVRTISWQKQTLSVLRINAYSSPSREPWRQQDQPHSESARSRNPSRKRSRQKSSVKLGQGHLKDSFQDLLRTARNKPHSAQAANSRHVSGCNYSRTLAGSASAGEVERSHRVGHCRLSRRP